jgi:hypothetical protein
MPAYQLVNACTGFSLYQVGAATEEDICRANRNLAESGSLMRYEPVSLAPALASATLERPSIPTA